VVRLDTKGLVVVTEAAKASPVKADVVRAVLERDMLSMIPKHRRFWVLGRCRSHRAINGLVNHSDNAWYPPSFLYFSLLPPESEFVKVQCCARSIRCG
jgi:hypothetical protein